MSDKVKLIIEVSKEIYQEAIKSGYSHLYDEEVANAVADGIPLNDLKTKIETDLSWDMFDEYGNETGLHKELMVILDNIGKAESEE